MNQITIEELLKLHNPIIIDLRPHYLYKESHILNSLNIKFENLISNSNDYLNKDNTYYLYCEYGKKSLLLSNYLNQLGFNTYSLINGFSSYNINN